MEIAWWKGHPGAGVATGVLASRARAANPFGCKAVSIPGHREG